MRKIVHFEIPADDEGRARTFYREVFGLDATSGQEVHTIDFSDVTIQGELTKPEVRKIARREELREPEAVRSGDLEAALDRDIPDRDPVQQRLELCLERVEADREVHVVVDREALRAVALGRLVVRRAPVAGAPLDLAHVERRGGSHGGQGEPPRKLSTGAGAHG